MDNSLSQKTGETEMNHPFLRMSMTSFFILISRQIFLGPITDQTPASKTVFDIRFKKVQPFFTH